MLAVVAGPSVWAGSEIEQIDPEQQQLIVTQDPGQPWQLGDTACVVRGGQRMACGHVDAANSAGARVILTLSRGSLLFIGDQVEPNQYVSQVFKVEPDGLSLLITHNPSKMWEKDDRVCIVVGAERLTCGVVISSGDTLAQVALLWSPKSELPKGAPVEPMYSDQQVAEQTKQKEHREQQRKQLATQVAVAQQTEREIQSINDTPVEIEVEHKWGDFFIDNVSGGVNYLYPVIRFEKAIRSRLALGLMPMYFHRGSTGSISGLGAQVTLTYYPQKIYRGPWLTLALGALRLQGELSGTEASANSLIFTMAGGWRWLWASGYHLGMGAGINHLTSPEPGGMNFNFSGLAPAIMIDIGFLF